MANCGSFHTVTLDTEGFVWGFGENNQGQLGIANSHVVLVPTILEVPKSFAVSCGNCFTVCIDMDGEMWTFGSNNNGQLGNGSTVNNHVPTKIPSSLGTPKFEKVSCGATHVLCVGFDKSLWGFGDNKYGQLGLEPLSQFVYPQKLALSDISIISCGSNYSFASDISGDLYSVGSNEYGQLGQNTKLVQLTRFTKINIGNLQVTSIACGSIHTIILLSDGNVYGAGNASCGRLGSAGANVKICYEFIKFMRLKDIIKISCGVRHSFFIDSNYNLWGCGNNSSGELGTGGPPATNILKEKKIRANVFAISQGGSHSIMYDKKEDKILVCGLNISGQLGLNDSEKPFVYEPIPIGADYSNIVCFNQIRAKSARK